MNIVVEKQPQCVANLRVEIPAEQVKSERAQIVNAYASRARVPGFRPGKAPKAIIEKRFAKEIAEELNDNLVSSAYDATLKQHEDLRVLDFGNPLDLASAEDGTVSFSSTITLAPDITLPEYKGITVTVPPLDVPQADLDTELQALRERFADFKSIEGRAAAMGDFAVIDYTATVEGKPVAEFLGKPAGHLEGREGYWVRLDEEAFLPGFAAKLAGANVGDSKEITLTLPTDFPVSQLSEKDITLQVEVKELKEADLPELNDEFAAKLLPNGTMEALTDLIRSSMQDERKRRIEDSKVNQIVEHLNAKVDCELPNDLVRQETQSQADAMVDRGIRSGMSNEDIASQKAEIFASATQQATTNIRTNFILQEIADAENIQVSDTEVINYLANLAQQRKEPVKPFIKKMSRAGRIPGIRGSIKVGKAIDFLVEHATIVEAEETSGQEANA